MLIVVPYWGNDPKYAKLLTEWVTQYEASGSPHDYVIATDTKTNLGSGDFPYQRFDVSDYYMDSSYAFDRKGAIVCEAIKLFCKEDLLVLDADALVQFDPASLLPDCPEYTTLCMGEDLGAKGKCLRLKDHSYSIVHKRNAGVMYFPSKAPVCPSIRSSFLVISYIDAFREMLSGKYSEARELYEQHAWSIVAHKLAAPYLPNELNWPDHLRGYGPNPKAAIYHRIGKRKWNL